MKIKALYLDGRTAGSHDDALHPEPDEGGEGTEGGEYVGVVGAGLFYHAAQLGVTVGPSKNTIRKLYTIIDLKKKEKKKTI